MGTCYVSACRRQWVNRGFLHGPLLPIYGSGATIILFVTLPVEQDLRLVFLLGMIAATVLEYVTGAVMERLFKVRYWDYSHHRFNLNGHICLTSSLAWGFFSILLVRFIHPPIAGLLADVPGLAGGSAGSGHHRGLHGGRGPLRPGSPGPQRSPHPSYGGERGPAAPSQTGRRWLPPLPRMTCAGSGNGWT